MAKLADWRGETGRLERRISGLRPGEMIQVTRREMKLLRHVRLGGAMVFTNGYPDGEATVQAESGRQ